MSLWERLFGARSEAAHHELQIFVGADGIVRVNVDGVCQLRVRMQDSCRFVVTDTRYPKPTS